MKKVMDNVLKIMITIVNIAIVTLVLIQKDREAGLGALTGQQQNSYWARNEGRSAKGRLILATRCAAFLFLVLAIIIYAVS